MIVGGARTYSINWMVLSGKSVGIKKLWILLKSKLYVLGTTVDDFHQRLPSFAESMRTDVTDGFN